MLNREFGPFQLEMTLPHVALITFSHPPVNALNHDAYQSLIDWSRYVDHEPAVRVVVLTATADKAFIGGGDIREMAHQHLDDPGWPEAHARLVRSAFEALYECAVPVIAAVTGAVLGGGIAVVACCDIVVAADSAVFGLPEIDVGVLGGARHLQRLVSQQKARQMMYTAERITAQELLSFGSVHRIVPRKDVITTATELAQTIAAKSPAAIKLAKRGLNHLERSQLGLYDGYEYEQTLTRQLADHPDSREAARAFFEKREPRFGE